MNPKKDECPPGAYFIPHQTLVIGRNGAISNDYFWYLQLVTKNTFGTYGHKYFWYLLSQVLMVLVVTSTCGQEMRN